MFWFGRKKNNVSSQSRRAFRVERLETRDLLSGIVNVLIAPNPLVTPGSMALAGDVSNNHVQVSSGAGFGEFVITGLDGTLLQLNGAGVTMPQMTVNGINGNIGVDLDGGRNQFDMVGPAAGMTSQLGGSLLITNRNDNVTVISDTMINGDVHIARAPLSAGYSELRIINSTVIGDTIVNNAFGGSDGDSYTYISNSKLQAGGATATGLTLSNGDGKDIIQIEGTSQFGTGIFPPALPVVTITNGDGGSRTTFTGNSTIYGAVLITNGANLTGTLDIVTFNQAQTTGSVTIIDSSGDTETSVQTSKLGTAMTPGGGPLVVRNNAGADSFVMTNSEVQWGVLLDNDNVPGGASMWGSSTDIRDSKIGTHPNGPVLPAPPAGVNDSLMILGDRGADVVGISGTTIGGDVNLRFLRDGNNSVTLATSKMAGLAVVTGAGNDSVVIDQTDIVTSINIVLAAGADSLTVRGTGLLPDPLLGAWFIDGGIGVDTYRGTRLLLMQNFEVLLPS
jgi:hypothetical protein